jgi:hypothetical protein
VFLSTVFDKLVDRRLIFGTSQDISGLVMHIPENLGDDFAQTSTHFQPEEGNQDIFYFGTGRKSRPIQYG